MSIAIFQGNPLTDGQALESLFAMNTVDILKNSALATRGSSDGRDLSHATHKGLSYSQSFTQTIVYVTVIVAFVMMVIGARLERAFALVTGPCPSSDSVRWSRTPRIQHACLRPGAWNGGRNLKLQAGCVGIVFMSGLAWFLSVSNFGALYKSEFILRFVFDQSKDSSSYLERIREASKRSSLLNIEPSGDGQLLKLTYDIQLEKEADAQRVFISALSQAPGVSEVVLIVPERYRLLIGIAGPKSPLSIQHARDSMRFVAPILRFLLLLAALGAVCWAIWLWRPQWVVEFDSRVSSWYVTAMPSA
ncbi:MAG: hypothetical protein R3E96_01680 [Planctomycetota bacterium]